ncbi:MAG: hypothetical protein KTR13_03905 [Saprospiraceae bacterium]|nr:hypothetical protein [Saprospiraceae bacterium]
MSRLAIRFLSLAFTLLIFSCQENYSEIQVNVIEPVPVLKISNRTSVNSNITSYLEDALPAYTSSFTTVDGIEQNLKIVTKDVLILEKGKHYQSHAFRVMSSTQQLNIFYNFVIRNKGGNMHSFFKEYIADPDWLIERIKI